METVRLGEIASFSQGLQVPIRDQESSCSSDDYVRFIRIVDYTEATEDIRYVKRPDPRFIVNEDDIVMIRYGSASMGMVGRGKRGVIANNMFKISPDEKRVHKSYLFYCLQSDAVQRTIWLANASSTMPALTFTIAGNLEIPLPSLQFQRKISGILCVYDELIENSLRRIRILEAMARTLYREWFVHSRVPGDKMRTSAAAKSPDCTSGTLGGLCDLRKDTYDDAEHSELPLLDLARMPSRTLAPQDTGKPSELTTSRIVFQKGDTLFGAIRCYLHKVVEAHYSGVTNTSVLVLRPKKPCFRSLLAIIASDAETIRWAETQSTGTKMPVINWSIFQKMPAPVPSQALAQEFENIAGPMLDQIGAHANQIQNLRRTRDLLLPRLLSGQVNLGEN